MDAVLSAKAELMGEFKRGKHSNWDLDEEIWTWNKKAVVLAGGEVSEDEVSTSTERSLKDKDPFVESKPNVGAKTVELVVEATDADVEPSDQTRSYEDITTN